MSLTNKINWKDESGITIDQLANQDESKLERKIKKVNYYNMNKYIKSISDKTDFEIMNPPFNSKTHIDTRENDL